MAVSAAAIVIVAGSATFVNEWYVTGQVNWRVPIATALGAAALDGIQHIDNNAGVGLAVMVLIGAITARFNGQSVFDTISQWFSKTPQQKQPQPKPHAKVA